MRSHIEERAIVVAKYILEKNKSERHIRGGMATKLKYEKETQKDVG